jgi:hypothetical protein
VDIGENYWIREGASTGTAAFPLESPACDVRLSRTTPLHVWSPRRLLTLRAPTRPLPRVPEDEVRRARQQPSQERCEAEHGVIEGREPSAVRDAGAVAEVK